MVDGVENPYRTDSVADALFVGRDALIAELVVAVRDGRNAIRAVMGGRGMGKSSLARQLEKRLGSDALTVVVSGNVRKVASVLGRELKVDLKTDDPVDALVQSARQPTAGRVANRISDVVGQPS